MLDISLLCPNYIRLYVICDNIIHIITEKKDSMHGTSAANFESHLCELMWRNWHARESLCPLVTEDRCTPGSLCPLPMIDFKELYVPSEQTCAPSSLCPY